MTLNQLSKSVSAWLDKPFSPSEEKWLNKFQILKTNYGKAALALAFFAGAWWYENSWFAALVIVAAIYGHELGHLWAMNSVGMGAKGTWFIPFFGGVAIAKDVSKATHWERWVVVVMGPLWGFVMALVLFLVYKLAIQDRLDAWRFDYDADSARLAATIAISCEKAIRDIALLNLLNLLPLPFLDGGRMIGEMILSFSRKTAAILLMIFAGTNSWLLLKYESAFLATLSGLGMWLIWSRWKDDKPAKKMSGAEVLIGALFHFGLMFGLMFIFGIAHDDVLGWEKVLAH